MSRVQRLNQAADQIQALLPEGLRVTWAGACSDGWDDGVEIACGESKGLIIIWAYGHGHNPHIEQQTVSMAAHLQACEQRRLDELRADDDTFIWFYRHK